MDSIASLRQEIDQVHKELHALLLRRRELTMAVWKIKQEQGLPFLAPSAKSRLSRASWLCSRIGPMTLPSRNFLRAS